MAWLIILLFFVFFGVIMFACAIGFKFLETGRRMRVEQMLKTVSSVGVTVEAKSAPALEVALSPVEGSTLVSRIAVLRNLDALTRGAALDWRVEGVIGAMAGMALLGGFVGYRYNLLVFPWLSIAGLAVVFAMAPVAYIKHKRNARLNAFEGQFPDALDFLARSVRAGHALTISLEMLANESEAPLAPEFRRLTNELNLGTPFDVGLRNLCDRVPLVDVRFFVSAVLLQRETGGNLTEMLANLAELIRSRFRLKGQVKALAAQGKMTAGVLTALPIFLAVAFSYVAPHYLKGMAEDPIGRYMILGAIAGQVIGYFVMQRIVNIKV